MKKKIYIGLAILCLLLVIVYNYQSSGPGFQEIYKAVEPDVSSSLNAFRTEYPAQTVEIEGAAWKYLSTGSGTETILFLHGMTGGYDIWWQQILALKDSYRIITVTYPPIDNLEGMAAGIIQILKKEQVDRVNLVGSSLGGYFTQYLVAHHPEKVNKAVFANTFPPNKLIAEKNKTIGSLLPVIPGWAVMGVLRENTEKALYPASGNSELVKAYMMEQSYGMMTKDQFVARFHCVIDPFEPADLEKLGIPVLIIEADNDPLVEPALRKMLKQTYPIASVKTLSGVGHFPYLNEPEAYIEVLRRHFN